MNSFTCIKKGRIIDPKNNRDSIGDLYIRDGKIVPAFNTKAQETNIIDAEGLVVAPGLVDIHVHLREPGQTNKEDTKTGSQAAAAGGFTSIVCMPNTEPAIDNLRTLALINQKIKEANSVNVYTSGTLTIGRQGKELAPMGALKEAGVVAFTDDGDCIQDNEVMRRAVEYAKMLDIVVMDHCQDAWLTRGAVMHEGAHSIRLGLKGWPSSAEDMIVARNIILSQHTGAHIHLQHISTKSSVNWICEAKKQGIRITAEATPHHITLLDTDIGNYKTNFKMNPPLRTRADQEAIIEGLLDGTIDIIATDHAPHAPEEKDNIFNEAPFGILGLETCLPVTLQALVASRKMKLKEFLSLLTYKPAEIVKINKGTLSEGADADVILFDPESSFNYTTSFSKSLNSPWLGQELKGEVKMTLVEGRTVYNSKDYLNKS